MFLTFSNPEWIDLIESLSKLEKFICSNKNADSALDNSLYSLCLIRYSSGIPEFPFVRQVKDFTNHFVSTSVFGDQDESIDIYVLKQNYLNIILNDMDTIMPYKTGSTQYMSETLVRGENIKLYS